MVMCNYIQFSGRLPLIQFDLYVVLKPKLEASENMFILCELAMIGLYKRDLPL